MKKYGFTLAELIGVIVILALISLITVPAISKTLNKNKISLCKTQLENILAAAKSYGAENIYSLPSESGEYMQVTLETLVSNGYIEKDIQNPITKETFSLEDTTIKITKENKKYVYELDEATIDLCNTD